MHYNCKIRYLTYICIFAFLEKKTLFTQNLPFSQVGKGRFFPHSSFEWLTGMIQKKIRSAILIPEKCKRQCLRQSNGEKKHHSNHTVSSLYLIFNVLVALVDFTLSQDLHLISPTYWDFCQICQVLCNISKGAHSVY